MSEQSKPKPSKPEDRGLVHDIVVQSTSNLITTGVLGAAGTGAAAVVKKTKRK